MIRRRSKSVDRIHRRGVFTSSLLGVLGIFAIGLGGFAWAQARPEPVRFSAGAGADLQSTPMFEPGLTVFAQTEDDSPRSASAWGCVHVEDGAERALRATPDFNAVGSRVLDGKPFIPVVTIGPTMQGDRVRCSPDRGLPTDFAAMTTSVGVRSIPLALVVAGIGSLGLAGLVHPRGRGIERFSR